MSPREGRGAVRERVLDGGSYRWVVGSNQHSPVAGRDQQAPWVRGALSTLSTDRSPTAGLVCGSGNQRRP